MKPVAFADQTPPAPLTAAAPATTPAIPVPTYPIRIYAVRGVAKGGRAGQPSSRVQVPLVPPPPAPTAVTVSATEQALVLSWTALHGRARVGPAISFNVYQAGTEASLNPRTR